MKTITGNFLLSGILILAISCSQSTGRRYANESAPPSDTNSMVNMVSSSAAVQKGSDSSRRFIRTATMKFRVPSVIDATYRIEEITSDLHGFVIHTALNSRIVNSGSIQVSPDSTLETIKYIVENEMVIRVPNHNLDTTLKSIGRLIEYLDYRNIDAEDVKLKIMANQMTQRRVSMHEERLSRAIDEKGKKLNETTSAEDNLLRKQELADEARLANLSLTDQVEYSTVRLIVYQREEMKRWLVPNERNIKEYEPGFGSKFIDSIKFGWDILAEFILAITKLWAIILFGIIIYLFIRLYRARKRQ